MITPNHHNPDARVVLLSRDVMGVIEVVARNSIVQTRPDLFGGQRLDISALTEESIQLAKNTLQADPAANSGHVLATVVNFIAEKIKEIDHHSFFRASERLLANSEAERAQQSCIVPPEPEASLDSLSLPPVAPPDASAARTQDAPTIKNPPFPLPTCEMKDEIAVLWMPWCTPSRENLESEMSLYLEAGLRNIRDCQSKGARAWVIDLRRNSGGNMYPMLAAIWPLLNTDNPGSFEDPRPFAQAKTVTWREALQHNIPGISLGGGIGTINQPVAVWTSRWTASSGEITSIAFRERPNTLFLGSETAGIPTSNQPFEITNHDCAIGTLWLTTALCVDRNGNAYTAEMRPDIEVTLPQLDGTKRWSDQGPAFEQAWEASNDKLLEETRSWINSL